MPFQRRLLFTAAMCFFIFAGHGQSSDWQTMQYGKLSLNFPPTWHERTAIRGDLTMVILTPDSMQHLHWGLITINTIGMSPGFTFAKFKTEFASRMGRGSNPDDKVLKTEEISFKNHETMYGEVIMIGLPAKVYAVHAGTEIYQAIFITRRHVNIPDSGIERDEQAILNSITIAQ